MESNKVSFVIAKYRLTPLHFFAFIDPVGPVLDEANIVDNPKVLFNRTATLECHVTGTPAPQIHWLKDGLPLTLRPGVRLLANRRQLEIFRSQVTDAGRYTCVAENEGGEVRRDYSLSVLGENTTPPLPPSLSYHRPVHSTASHTLAICTSSSIQQFHFFFTFFAIFSLCVFFPLAICQLASSIK